MNDIARDIVTHSRIRPATGWLQTYTGKAFYPTAPHVNDVDILDIAHALSLQCRYNGHSKFFYSVAEHSVLISDFVSRENALWGLLHDGTEPYVGDMIRPLKLQLPAFREIEDAVEVVIAAKFGMSLPIPDEVETVDKMMIADERLAVMNTPAVGMSWSQREPLGITIHGWSPPQAELEFLVRFAQLTGDPTTLVAGLCSANFEHDAHVVRSSSLGIFWCPGMEIDPDAVNTPGRLPKLRNKKRFTANANATS